MMSDDCRADNSAGPDAVYSEMYNEMRRYRDYEFSSSMWYTALLLALLGALIAVRFGGTAPGVAAGLSRSCFLQIVVIVTSAAVAGTASYLIRYSSRRYRHLRNWVTYHMEPAWKTRTFQDDPIALSPRHIYYITPWVLFLAIVVVVALPASSADATLPSAPPSPRAPAEPMLSRLGSEFPAGLVGAVLGALATLLVQWLTRRDTYRQGAYTERARAVQDLLDHARKVKDSCVAAQAAKGTSKADATKQEVEAAKQRLLGRGFYHDVWISERHGVQSVRDFNTAIDADRMQAMTSCGEVEAALAPAFDRLRKALKKDLGFEPR